MNVYKMSVQNNILWLFEENDMQEDWWNTPYHEIKTIFVHFSSTCVMLSKKTHMYIQINSLRPSDAYMRR